jgi:Mg2+-importing ATPase
MTVALIALALVFPYLPLVGYLGFVRLPSALLLSLVAITVVYVAATEGAKRRLFRWADPGR